MNDQDRETCASTHPLPLRASDLARAYMAGSAAAFSHTQEMPGTTLVIWKHARLDFQEPARSADMALAYRQGWIQACRHARREDLIDRIDDDAHVVQRKTDLYRIRTWIPAEDLRPGDVIVSFHPEGIKDWRVSSYVVSDVSFRDDETVRIRIDCDAGTMLFSSAELIRVATPMEREEHGFPQCLARERTAF